MPEYRISVVVSGEGGAEIRDMEHAAKGVDRQFDNVDRTLGRVFDKLGSVGRKMMLLGTGIVGGVAALTVVGGKSAATYELAEARLKTFLKTNEAVKTATTWAERKEFKTPFDETAIMNTMAVMEKAGLDYREWFDTIGNAAVAASASNEEAVAKTESLSRAIGMIVAGNRRGFMMLAREFPELMTKAGLEIEEGTEGWAKMVEKPDEALKKLRAYMDGEFSGAMERMSKTGDRVFFRLKDTAEDTLRAAVTPMFKEATGKLQLFLEYLQSPAGIAALERFSDEFGRTLMEAAKMGVELGRVVLPVLQDVVHGLAEADPRLRVWLMLLPLAGGAALVTASKVGKLALALKMVGMFGPGAGKGIAGATGAAGAGIGAILGYAAALAVMVAHLYGIVKGSEWVAGKLGLEGWGIVGSMKKTWEFSKGWNPFAGKFGDWSAWGGGENGKKFVQEPGEGQTPMKTPTGPMGPLTPGGHKWRGLMAGWTATPAGGPGPAAPPPSPNPPGTGGGGGGGAGSKLINIYQTYEAGSVVIKADNVTPDKLRALMGQVYKEEAMALGG